MKIFKNILMITLVSSVLFTYSQKKIIETQITFIQPYCGGARPSSEMLAEAQKQKPYSNKTIIFVSKKGKVDSVKTNEAGLFKAKLKKGSYKLFEAWRYYKGATGGMLVSDFDLACLKGEWNKEIKEITVSKIETKVIEKNEIIEVCPWNLPCILESHKPPARE